MRAPFVPAMAIALVLSGCGSANEPGTEASAPTASAESAKDAAAGEALTVDNSTSPPAGEQAQAPRAPQIAYTYEYGFRLPGRAITTLQQRHADLCASKGPAVCRVLSMSQSGAEGDYASGQLALEIAAAKASAFGKELAEAADRADGEQVSSSLAGEDLSKNIVDTEARLRARILLRDRLMEILRSRQGSVAELVEAERGVAQVNEEIDQAQSWLAEMKGRVAFSHVTVNYASASPSAGGFLDPIRSAFGSLGSVLGMVIAGLIVLVTGLIPIAILVLAVIWGVRRVRSWKRGTAPAEHEPGPAAGERPDQ